MLSESRVKNNEGSLGLKIKHSVTEISAYPPKPVLTLLVGL